MLKKVTLLGAFLVALIYSLAPAVAQQDQAIRSIKSAGVVRIAFAESPPFAVKNPGTNSWEGFNVDMANDLATALGVRLEIVDSTWATMINALLAGQADVLMASTFATPERAQSVVFTDSYITAGELILVHKDSPYQKHEDLNQSGIVITALTGTTNERTARTLFPEAEVRALATENQVAPVLEVANGRADANVADANSAKRFVRLNPDSPIRILEPERVLNQAQRAYSVRPGEYHLLNFLDTWIEGQTLSGRIDALKEKWELE